MFGIDDLFSSGFREATEKFQQAARSAGATLDIIPHPVDRDGRVGPVATSIAQSRANGAGRALVTVSATHGVEGYCGSACQTGLLLSGLHHDLAARGVALIQVHALNPWGFAFDRRVTEHNVDLNRNFLDPGACVPQNHGYRRLHPLLVPDTDTIAGFRAAGRELDAALRTRGHDRCRSQITRGQYDFSDGLFFGGTRPCWSNRTWRGICGDVLAAYDRLIVLEFHTGLGAYGAQELIYNGSSGSPACRHLAALLGDRLTVAGGTGSSSAAVVGSLAVATEALLAPRMVLPIVVEYGTVPFNTLLRALCFENWCHQRGWLAGAAGGRIKKSFRRAFYPDDGRWRDQVWHQARALVDRAAAWLAADL